MPSVKYVSPPPPIYKALGNQGPCSQVVNPNTLFSSLYMDARNKLVFVSFSSLLKCNTLAFWANS
jgi:hypothetical protein